MPSHQWPSWASGGEVAGPPMQQTPSDCTRVVLHALVLGPGDHVKSDPTVSALSASPLAQLFNQTLHRNLVNLSLHTWPLEPQLPRRQGFPEAVAARIEAPQEDQPDQYMRQSGPYVLQSDTSVIRWTSTHHLMTSLCTCFKTGSYSQAPLMAIDQPFLTIGKFTHECQPRKISLISRIVSTETDPRAEGHPPWNLFLFLHQLTKAPFEPLKEASPKHLTF